MSRKTVWRRLLHLDLSGLEGQARSPPAERVLQQRATPVPTCAWEGVTLQCTSGMVARANARKSRSKFRVGTMSRFGHLQSLQAATASSLPTPGGGPHAAIAALNGAALLEMCTLAVWQGDLVDIRGALNPIPPYSRPPPQIETSRSSGSVPFGPSASRMRSPLSWQGTCMGSSIGSVVII